MFWRWVSVGAAFRRERERQCAVSIAATALLTGAAVGVCRHYCVYWSDYSSPVAHDFGSVRIVLGLLTSALGGALLITLSDLGARTLVPFLICRLFLRLWWAARRSSCCCVVSLGQSGGAERVVGLSVS